MSKSLENRISWSRLRQKYKCSSKEKKQHLLDELTSLSGMNRKYLTRKLNQKASKKRLKRGVKPIYDRGLIIPILKTIWLASDQPCGKRLKALLPLWLPFYEQENLDEDLKQRLLQISSATLDRLLQPMKSGYSGKGLSGTKPGSLIKNQIPIKTNQWEETKPGFMEADTVAHCGTSLEGDFVWSLTMTDIHTAWTENRATWNKGSHGVGEQIDDIESSLPFELRGFDCDNGSEFLNYHILRKFQERPKNSPIQFTRSRPYKKNDNAHVEQKNWTHVRHLFGYSRFGKPILVKLMNDLYRNEWSLYQNHFLPNMKCVKKIKVGSKYKKVFDVAKTPYERVLNCSEISKEEKNRLREIHEKLNPFELKKQIEKKLKKIFKHVELNKAPRKKI